MALAVGANLNKKIKKIDFGTQISAIKKKTLLLMLLYLFLIASIFSITVIYSLTSLKKLTDR